MTTITDLDVDSRPIRDRLADYTLVRAVLLAGIVGGTLVPLYYLLLADTTPLAWDFRAYRHAAELFVSGEPFIGASPSVGGGRWVYPPIVVLLFVPFAAFPTLTGAYAAATIVNIGLLVLTARLVIRIVERVRREPLTRVDRLLLTLFIVTNTFSAVVIGQGQIDPLVCVTLAGGFLALESGRETRAGVLFAVAAVIKLFPVVVGAWLLYRRAYRAVAAAVATGVGAIIASFAVFGVETHRRYLHFVLYERSRLETAASGIDPNYSSLTLHRPLSVLFPELSPNAYVAIAVIAFIPVIVVCFMRTVTVIDRLVAFLVTLTASLLVTPATMIHHAVYLLVPLLPLLYGIKRPAIRRTLCIGTLAMLFPVLPAQIDRVLAMADTLDPVRAGVMSVVTPVLTTATVTLYGLLIVVSVCVSYRVWTLDVPREDSNGVPGD
ncbi:glycosyltransferase family 87 protein [Halostella sp. PRR32]|uniref:glycosyltransferase family 87 protein n=1 Tax=Halostella sp. PRR32 TaxID=3098147 RepID=UPI002B1DA539|nr:glycosyltransferase family 87 protein [Halostella sp. PRR32]